MNETTMRLMQQVIRLDLLVRRMHSQGYAVTNPYRGQGRVMSILRMQPEIGQKELSYLLDMSKQGLGELLSKLEKSGYITRERSEKDHRAWIIKLTDKGREALPDETDETAETADNNLINASFDSLNDEEQHNLSDYMERIISCLEEKLGKESDESDYADFVKERFFAKHGFGWNYCDKD
jgi:DNA-binding MarR family transcriptional regulator